MLDLNSKKNLKDIVFDNENTAPVELVNQQGERLKLEQVFAAMYNERAYCILAPINEVIGLEKGTGLVFEISGDSVCLERNDEISTEIFNMYYATIGSTQCALKTK